MHTGKVFVNACKKDYIILDFSKICMVLCPLEKRPAKRAPRGGKRQKAYFKGLKAAQHPSPPLI